MCERAFTIRRFGACRLTELGVLLVAYRSRGGSGLRGGFGGVVAHGGC